MSKKKPQQHRHQGRTRRPLGTREVRQRFLIVCEGEKTEPAYFNSFRVPSVVINVHAVGKDPLTLVHEAKKRVAGDSSTYDQVWCVFDRDAFLPERIGLAIRTAEAEGYKVALSNPLFELWYVLHFEYVGKDTIILRQDYGKKLGKWLNSPYAKNDPDMYEKLREHQKTAIQNATRLLASYSPFYPITSEPSTRVHELVQALNKHSRP